MAFNIFQIRFYYLFIAGFAAVFIFSPSSVFAAEASLSLTPGNGAFNMGDTFSVRVLVDSSGDPINAAEVKLLFDRNVLQVVSISKEGSAFSLWTVEPVFSNSDGTIEFGGGNPKPFTAKSTLATIIFKSLKTGNVKVDFSSGSVLAADGKGTDILSQKIASNYEIKPKPAASLSPTAGSSTPPLPIIESDTHSDPGIWYNTSKIKFKWSIPVGVLSVRSVFDDQVESVPTDLEPPATTSKEIESKGGVSYFHLQYKNKDVWGPIAHKKVMIDLTPPTEASVEVEAPFNGSAMPALKLGAKDDLSGLRNFEVIIGPNPAIVVKPEELTDDLYSIPESVVDGNYQIIVKAYDNAGNFAEQKIDLEIKTSRAAPKSQVSEDIEEKTWFQKFRELFSIQLIIIIVQVALIFFLGYRIIGYKKAGASQRETVRRGAMDIRVLMGKIFSALIDEVEEQLISLDHKPRFSENEQRIFDKIKEAVDISEGLIDDQIKVVEKSVEDQV